MEASFAAAGAQGQLLQPLRLPSTGWDSPGGRKCAGRDTPADRSGGWGTGVEGRQEELPGPLNWHSSSKFRRGRDRRPFSRFPRQLQESLALVNHIIIITNVAS